MVQWDYCLFEVEYQLWNHSPILLRHNSWFCHLQILQPPIFFFIKPHGQPSNSFKPTHIDGFLDFTELHFTKPLLEMLHERSLSYSNLFFWSPWWNSTNFNVLVCSQEFPIEANASLVMMTSGQAAPPDGRWRQGQSPRGSPWRSGTIR